MTEELPFCECGCGLRVTKLGNKFLRGHSGRKPIPEPVLCGCGCGEYALPGNRFIKGHENRGRKRSLETIIKRTKTYKENAPKPKMGDFCYCGCGERAAIGSDFISGHNGRGEKRPPEVCAKISKARTGVPVSDIQLIAIRKAARKEKDPLPNGWEIKTGKMATNKDCGLYLGNIAEQLLSKLYPDVQVMPQGNPGYDFICGKGLKIDVKSSTLRKDGSLYFTIGKNKIADYFICVAFDNRENFNVIHLWLMPGWVLNGKHGAQISVSTLERWSKYEQSLDTAILCCNEMKGD